MGPDDRRPGDTLTKGCTTRAQEAEAYGDKGVAVQIEDFIHDQSSHLEETERILRDRPL